MTEDGYTPEGREERRRELYAALLDRFRPYVQRELVRRLAEEVTSTVFENEDLKAVCDAAWSVIYEREGSEADADRYRREVRRRLILMEAVPPEERVNQYDMEAELEESLDQLVSTWLHVIQREALGHDGNKRPEFDTPGALDCGVLGPEMMPEPLSEKSADLLGEGWSYMPLGTPRARQILALIRSNLRPTDGERLPREALDLLAMWNLDISNG